MAYNRDFEIIEEQIAKYLESTVNRVKNEEDVDVLASLNKLIKKNVPLSLRKYVSAYLLKEILKHSHSYGRAMRYNNSKKSNQKAKHEFKATEKVEEQTTEPRVHHERVQIPADEAVSIFVSIGKNRRVFPRDLVGLLIAVGGLERDRIGDIKVLANYSFVQLYSNDAQTAIEKLNGYDYRGRKLAVSFSRQKSEEELADNENAESQDFDAKSQDYVEDEEMAAEDAAAYAAAEKAASDKEPFGLN